MPRVHVELSVDAPVDACWDAVTDVESFAEAMDDVNSVKILEQSSPDRRQTAWSVQLKGSVLEWVESESIDHASRRFEFHQVQGDLACFAGLWTVCTADSGTSLITLDVEFDIGIPLLEDMLNPVATRALRDNSAQMLAALERRLTGQPR
ncbi:SRPBCC family protein [Streptomyces sp. NPDC005728]|uniref:type II toxin-antitoxin system RatA family toxin n=1 Tax=Streptomyces sp. NPDC005728 TaxID=3157054 RepID=UPI0033DFED0D